MMPKEKQIQDSILEWLTMVKIFHYRQNTGAFAREYTRKDGSQGRGFVKFGTKGASDIVCVVKGHYIAIEVKDHKGKQSEDQKEFQRAVEEAGGTYVLVRSLDEVRVFFQGFYNSLK